MKTTRMIQLSLIALLGVACVKQKGDSPTPAPEVTDITAIEPLVDYDVPVQSGKTTVVTLVNSDTRAADASEVLAVTKEPMSISVPRSALAKGQIKVEYTTADIYDNVGSSEWWQYISFEDTRNADYDYNDLVIHVRVTNSNAGYINGKVLNKHLVSVQPIALGSSKTIKLGILYKESESATEIKEQILVNDCRAELFNGIVTFPINTRRGNFKVVSDILKPLFVIKNYDPKFKVAWFIEVGDGVRFYAATTNFGLNKNTQIEMLSADGLPYGISLTKKWDYPVEACDIRKAYSGFDAWLKSGDEKDLFESGKTAENTFPTWDPVTRVDLWSWNRNSPNDL